MFDQYMGVIKALGFQFVPESWGYCGGGLVSIGQFSALFSLLGCEFGGNCQNTFGLPDLRGRSLMGTGTGPGLTPRFIGQLPGWYQSGLLHDNIAAHSHGHTYSGSGASTEMAVHVAKAGGKKQLPDDGDFVAAPGNAFGAPQDNLFLAESDVTAVADIGGVGGGGGGFDTNQLVIEPTPQPTKYVDIMQPSVAVNYCICMDGLYPSRS